MIEQLLRELRQKIVNAHERLEQAHKRNDRLAAENRALIVEIGQQQKYIEELRQALEALQARRVHQPRSRRI